MKLTENDVAVGVQLGDKANGIITAELTWSSGVIGGADLDLFCVIGKERAATRASGRFNRLVKHLKKAEVVYHGDLRAIIALVDCTDPRGYLVRKAEQYSRPGSRTPRSGRAWTDRSEQGSRYLGR